MMGTEISQDRCMMHVTRKEVAAQTVMRRDGILILALQLLQQITDRAKRRDIDCRPKRRVLVLVLEMFRNRQSKR